MTSEPHALHAVLLAGGTGTRLWPESRRALPKQLLAIGSAAPLIVAAAERLEGLVPPERRWVVTSPELAEPIARLLPGLPRAHLLVEPQPRSTAGAVGFAAAAVAAVDPDAVLAALPADHVIAPAAAFRRVLGEAAARAASADSPIVLLGITPTRAAESYGYIQRGALQDPAAAIYAVASFHEKPSAATAARYFGQGAEEYSWNSGMFVARAQRFLQAIGTHAPGVGLPLAELAAALGKGPVAPAIAQRAFARMESISFDHAVLERELGGGVEVRVVDSDDLYWNDVGTWAALTDAGMAVDERGNSVQGDVLALDCSGSVLRAASDHLVVGIGLESMAVIHTPDATFVAPLHRADEVREARKNLEARGRHELL